MEGSINSGIVRHTPHGFFAILGIFVEIVPGPEIATERIGLHRIGTDAATTGT